MYRSSVLVPETRSDLPPELSKLIKILLSPNPNDRPSAASILKTFGHMRTYRTPPSRQRQSAYADSMRPKHFALPSTETLTVSGDTSEMVVDSRVGTAHSRERLHRSLLRASLLLMKLASTLLRDRDVFSMLQVALITSDLFLYIIDVRLLVLMNFRDNLVLTAASSLMCVAIGYGGWIWMMASGIIAFTGLTVLGRSARSEHNSAL